MCGIVGYIGREQAAPILLNGLGRLEYRGYDSAGICVAADGVLHVEKCKGRLANLEEKTEHGALLPGTLGIGHTRWATHGEPNDINSHPHLSQNGKIALVHNGIIENYLEIRTFLEEKGVKFVSQTDSEVVAPVSGVLQTVAETGHAFGIKTDDGVEVLVHVGIDTVKMNGEGFAVKVKADERVNAGDPLVSVDFAKVKDAGYSTTTLMTVLNTAVLTSVTPKTGIDVKAGDEVIDIQR